MDITKDTDNRIVIHLPVLVRVIGGIFFVIGATLLGIVAPHALNKLSLIVCICFGFPAVLCGIWLTGYRFKLTFDHTLGNMTIGTGVGPFTYSTRRISKRQVLGVRGGEMGESDFWAVSLSIEGRKKETRIIKFIDVERATYLVSTIRAFAEV